MTRRWIPLGVALVAALAHVESVGYWFVATDTITLTASSRAQTLAGVADLFTRPLMAGTRFTGVALFYRPLASLSHALDYALWGLDPAGYHATNLALHAAAVGLSTLVVAAVTDSRTGSLAGLLVAAHPLTAEVVPSVARRHSVLMSVFLLTALLLLVRGRRRGSRRLIAGSVGAYALALLTKELSLLFPGLVLAWVALDELADVGALTRLDADRAARTALRAVAPFVVVSAAYLGLRTAVLGGLGGYHRSPPLTIDGVVDVVTKYVLSLAYPRDVVSVATGSGGSGPSLAFGGLFGVGTVALLGLAVRRPRRRAGPLALATVTGGVGSIPIAVAVADRFGVGEVLLGYPTPRSAVVGALFVASLTAGALVALRALLRRRTAVRRDVGQPLAFFAVWLAAPVALFAMSREFTMRNGYLFLTPAMGAVSLVLVTAVRNADFDDREFDAGVALTGIAAVFVLSLAVTSPLVHDYDGWGTAGEVNRETLVALEEALDDAPEDAAIRVSGMPANVGTQMAAFPRVQSVGYVRAGTVESWLRLRDFGRPSVRTTDFATLPRAPTDASVTTERRDRTIRVEIRYTFRSSGRSRSDPSTETRLLRRPGATTRATGVDCHVLPADP